MAARRKDLRALGEHLRAADPTLRAPAPVVALDAGAGAPRTARAAGLRYVADDRPGIARRRAGKSFVYVGADGRRVTDGAEIARIKALAIPPAWTDVWICPDPRGHLQATGRDARGRKQYRYHARWRAARDETKFERMIEFGSALPAIRKRVAADLRRHGLPREKVIATIVRLLDTTLIRVGNEEYAKENGSYGLTTLRNRHVEVRGARLRFEFRAKSGKMRSLDYEDAHVARIVKRCRELPGQELFQYLDEDGGRRAVDSADVNEYLREVSGSDFTAKDFRTWAGTVLAACALRERGVAASEADSKRNIREAIEAVAHHLGNTPAVCRKAYVHPDVLEAYAAGAVLAARPAQARAPRHAATTLRPEERAVLAFLKKLQRRAARAA